MSLSSTVHTFRGESFQVAVRKNELTGQVSIAVLPSEGKQWEQLYLFEFECKTAAEASELSQLMKSAATMANHIEKGGPVESWRL